METLTTNKFKINQNVWYFDGNIWKPIKDVVYDIKSGIYTLVGTKETFEETELFSSQAKCWGDRKNK